MHINVTSIKKHTDEILARFNTYDIWSINETNLKPHQLFSLQGFNIFRNDRQNKQGGGVLLAIRKSIKCFEILNATIETNEAVAVQIETSLGQLLIATVYIPPAGKIQQKLFDEIYQLNNNCLILGDLNAALEEKGSRKTNAKGVQLKQILEEGYLQCIDNNLTTYARNNYEEKIDWILATQPTILFIDEVETHAPLGCKEDHKPITFNLSMTADLKPKSPRLTFNFNLANWNLYRKKLNEYLNKIDLKQKLETKEHIDTYTVALTNCITLAMKEAMPLANGKIRNNNVSEVTKKLIEEKHKVYRKWRKTTNEIDKKHYYKIRELVSNSIRNDRIEKLTAIMSTLSAKKMQSAGVWNTVKKFHNKRTKQSYSGQLIYQNTTANNDQEKANVFARYFENEIFVSKPDETPFHNQVNTRAASIKRKMKMETSSRENKFSPITENEIKCILKQLPNSAPGPDAIHNRSLKNYTKLLVIHLAKIFNAIVGMGHIPQEWKKANIILLLKPKKEKKVPSSYRPISLLSCLDQRTASVEIESTLSRSFALKSGTPQGSPLSPLLYILFTYDSMNNIEDHTQYGLFADDTALWAGSNTIKSLRRRLQTSANEFNRWFRSIITYGCTILLKTDNSIWKRMQILQNKALRAALGLPMYTSTEFIHLRTKIPMIKNYAKEILNKAISRAETYQDNTTTENLKRILSILQYNEN
ncbi:unnamed protein product [Adineta steineri]|uniref:Uncharacterized protein n=1 Tax=Adineta steineri TaxID=433720 RepID=A0A819UHH1_9BILA|nr:unnamed protein product [Adineta steineri]